jgi:transposase-like protein
MFKIIPAEKSEVTHLVCPHCKDKVPRVGLKKDSVVDGLTWTCRRCGMLWEVKTTAENKITPHN